MSDTGLPSSWGEVTIYHKIVYYTFLPFVAMVFLGFIATIVLYVTGAISFGKAILLPWLLLLSVISYLAFLGDYVMPSETYRKYRSGEWGDRTDD